MQSAPLSTRRCTVAALLAASLLLVSAPPGLAHHGWSWAAAEQSTLEATVISVSMAPPHPSIQVRDRDGTTWRIDFSNPNQTARSGWTAKSAKPGDTVTVIGNKHRDGKTKLMKAVRITVGGGKTYDMYPERVRAK